MMYHEHHSHSTTPAGQVQAHGTSLNRLAFTATLHCLSGCAVGEVLGMVIGTALGWSALSTIGLAVGLAFLFGYAFTMIPLLRAGLAFGAVLKLALAADTVSPSWRSSTTPSCWSFPARWTHIWTRFCSGAASEPRS